MRARFRPLLAVAWWASLALAQDFPPPPVDPPGGLPAPKIELGAPSPPAADAAPMPAPGTPLLPAPRMAIPSVASPPPVPSVVGGTPPTGTLPAPKPSAPPALAVPAPAAPKPSVPIPASAPEHAPAGEKMTIDALKKDVEAFGAKLAAAKDLKPEEKAKLEELQKSAVADLAAAEQMRGEAERRVKRIAEAPAEEQKYLAEWKQPVALPDYAPPAKATAENLRNDALRERAEYAKLKAEAETAEAAHRSRNERVQALQKQRGEVAKALAEAQARRSRAAGTLKTAERNAFIARSLALGEEARKLELDQKLYEAAPKLPSIRADVKRRLFEQQGKRLKAAEALASAAAIEEAKAAAAAAKKQRDPALQAEADLNGKLAAERAAADGPVELAAAAEKTKAALEQQIDKLKARFKGLREKVAKGVNSAVAHELRLARGEVDAALDHDSDVQRRRERIAASQIRALDLDNDRAALSDPARQADEHIAALGFVEERAAALRNELFELFEERRELQATLSKNHTDLVAALEALNERDADLLALARQSSEFITENVLWQRSARVFGPEEALACPEAARKLFPLAAWREAGLQLAADARRNPWSAGSVAALLVAWLGLHETMRRRLERLGRLVEKDYLHTFSLTARAAALTCVLSLLVPGVLWHLGNRIASFDKADPPVAALGAGVVAAAWVIAALELARQLCRRRGLAEAHFKWRGGLTAVVRQHLNVLLPIAAPMAFLVGGTQGQPNEAYQNSLGRLAFIVGTGATALVAARLFRPAAALMNDAFRDSGAMVRRLFFLAAAGTPAALAAMAFLGYYFAAYQLSLRLLPSLWAATAAVMAYALALRWANTARGMLALQRAAARRQEGADGKAKHSQDLDFATINLHTRRLARTGLTLAVAGGMWLLWSDVLPAFKGIADYPVWYLPEDAAPVAAGKPAEAVPAMSAMDEMDAAGDAKKSKGPSKPAVTPLHLLAAAALLWLTFAIGRSVPGLVEIVLASRGHGDPGARYALAALLRYAIGLVGILCVANALGLHWANVQWLVAGMTVGLGFGLQEIFANFVSGLILLFERPIRLGDTVTVGDLTGAVTKLRIRSTTITDGARRELVVPNKEFITGKLINWTLSDRVARVQVSIGVGYHTDPDLAMRTLLDVAAAQPNALKEPPPSASFESFGLNALEFKLAVYVANLDDAGKTKNELNTAIVRAFRAVGIECAAPRCDVTVRGLEGDILDLTRAVALRKAA